MSATLTTNSAASSPSPAQPTESTAVGDTSDADLGEITAAEISAALRELNPTDSPPAHADSTAPEPDADAASAADDAEPAGDDAAPAASDEAEPEAISDDASAPASDEATAPPSEGQPLDDDTAPAEDSDVAAAPKPRSRDARIDELTARAKTAQDELAQARERLAAYEARDVNRLEPDVLEAIDDPAALETQRSRWSKLHEWAIRHEHAEIAELPDGKGGKQEFGREEISALKAQTYSLLNEAAPKRQQFLQTRAQVDAYATQAYPWLANTKAGDGAVVAKLLTDLPVLRTLPGGKLLASDAFIGGVLRTHGITISKELVERLAKEAKAKAGAPRAASARPVAPVRAPAAPARAGIIPPRRDDRQLRQKQADKRMIREGGSVASLADSIAAKLG